VEEGRHHGGFTSNNEIWEEEEEAPARVYGNFSRRAEGNLLARGGVDRSAKESKDPRIRLLYLLVDSCRLPLSLLVREWTEPDQDSRGRQPTLPGRDGGDPLSADATVTPTRTSQSVAGSRS
jgi:hypothetical protein